MYVSREYDLSYSINEEVQYLVQRGGRQQIHSLLLLIS